MSAGAVSASMNNLSLQAPNLLKTPMIHTPNKRYRRNREDLQPGISLCLSCASLDSDFVFLPVVTERICVVGGAKDEEGVLESCESFGVPVMCSEDGNEHITRTNETVFVLSDFSGPEYDNLYRRECRIMGCPAVLSYASRKLPMPDLDRPLYCTAMENVVVCFTGFKTRDEVSWLVSHVHHMSGSIRKDFDYNRITHVIANRVGGEKYQYAVTFKIPVMSGTWVRQVWEQRHKLTMSTSDELMVRKHLQNLKLSPFYFLFVDFADRQQAEDFRRNPNLLGGC